MSTSRVKPVQVDVDSWPALAQALEEWILLPQAHWSKQQGADYDKTSLTDNQKEAGIAQTAEVDIGPWAPLFNPPDPVLPKDINSTDYQLQDVRDRRTFGSFSSDWMLWNKNELERQGTKKLLM